MENQPAKIKDIVDGLEIQADETPHYLNRQTGEVILVMLDELSAAEDDPNLEIEEYPEWQ